MSPNVAQNKTKKSLTNQLKQQPRTDTEKHCSSNPKAMAGKLPDSGISEMVAQIWHTEGQCPSLAPWNVRRNSACDCGHTGDNKQLWPHRSKRLPSMACQCEEHPSPPTSVSQPIQPGEMEIQVSIAQQRDRHRPKQVCFHLAVCQILQRTTCSHLWTMAVEYVLSSTLRMGCGGSLYPLTVKRKKLKSTQLSKYTIFYIHFLFYLSKLTVEREKKSLWN